MIWLDRSELVSVVWPSISLKMYYIQNKDGVWSRVCLNSSLEVQPVTEARVSSGCQVWKPRGFWWAVFTVLCKNSCTWNLVSMAYNDMNGVWE